MSYYVALTQNNQTVTFFLNTYDQVLELYNLLRSNGQNLHFFCAGHNTLNTVLIDKLVMA